MLQIVNLSELKLVQMAHVQHGPPGRIRTPVNLMELVSVLVIVKKMELIALTAPEKVQK